MTDFLHRKKDSTLWYYRRRFPKEVAQVAGKAVFLQSLKTSNKREAEKASRQVSVEFDSLCLRAISFPPAEQEAGALRGDDPPGKHRDPDQILAGIPALVRQGVRRVLEEQLKDPSGWQDLVRRWRMFYQSMIDGEAMPVGVALPAIEAQAFLNGVNLAAEGKVPPGYFERSSSTFSESNKIDFSEESWNELSQRALHLYQSKVSVQRHTLAKSKIESLQIPGTSLEEIQSALHSWCIDRLKTVKPRTVKTQLDCVVSALRCVVPKLTPLPLKELKGVMQPSVNDRQSIPLSEISGVLAKIKTTTSKATTRKNYNGGASSFDAIAIETLAVLGLRPRELIDARSNSIVEKTDFRGQKGLYLQIAKGKNKASEREIPVSDGLRHAIDIEKLREMLAWQDSNFRSPHGAVSSLGTRFKKLSNGYTPYQMRHTWKDVAVHEHVDMEIRERILGHRVRGIAGVYGSDIPLSKGLDALLAIRQAIHKHGG